MPLGSLSAIEAQYHITRLPCEQFAPIPTNKIRKNGISSLFPESPPHAKGLLFMPPPCNHIGQLLFFFRSSYPFSTSGGVGGNCKPIETFPICKLPNQHSKWSDQRGERNCKRSNFIKIDIMNSAPMGLFPK
jgi:hypothetical protein